MNASASGSVPSAREDRWLWLLFLVAWLIHFAFARVGWENTLISRFEFRQSQTALTTEHLPPGHLPLAYETPIFGPPWSIPLELPVYEAAVSTFSATTGLALDPSGRLVSWLFFQLSLPALYLLLGTLGVRPAARLLCLSLLLTSPLYLFFSRAFLIESTALCFCAWFLAAFARWLESGRTRWLVVASLAGALGASSKLTTMVVFGVAALLLIVDQWRRNGALRTLLLRAAAAFTVPVIGGLAWLVFSTMVRSKNPNADILNTHFGFWSFGDLAQRLSAHFWTKTLSVWTGAIVSEGGLVLGLYLFARLRTPLRPVVAGAFVAFLAGPLIFSNLYLVHDYYFYASGLFLVFALGLLLAAQYDDPSLPRWIRLGLPLTVMALQLMNYSRDYLPDQRRNQESTELIDALRDLTLPNDTVVFIGMDWDGTVPYYAKRRALMFVNGREWHRADVKQSIARLDPRSVGAVVIVGGLRSNAEFISETMPGLDLGAAPMLVSQPDQIGIWIPRARQPGVRDRLPLRPYATLEIAPELPSAGGARVIGLREISRRHDFDRLSPRPFEARSPADFSTSIVGGESMLNAHAPTELVFHLPPDARMVRAQFGIHDGAFTGKEHTDGVEFVILERTADGKEQVLHRRLLDPFAQAKDQGPQVIEFPLTPATHGDLVFRTLPGPHGSFSFDWAYWGEIRIR